MPHSTNESLNNIGKGTIIALIGTGVGTLIVFITRIIIARYGTEDQYGIFALTFAVLSICVLIASLGLQDGITRFIAYYRGKDEPTNVRQAASASIQLATITSIILGTVLFFSSETIATGLFNDTNLVSPFKIMALGVPFLTLINVFVAIFRGFDRVQEKVYFQDIAKNGLFLLLLLPMLLFDLLFDWVFYAFLASIILCAGAFVIYITKKLPVKLNIKSGFNPIGRQLLFFSLPLLLVVTLQLIITYTDTIMLGVFQTSDTVGFYNAALPLAQIITIPIGALLFIYAPITAGLYAKNLVIDIRRNYAVLTKWIFAATLPLFLILALFPDVVIQFFFGLEYTPASQTLRILSTGFIIVNLLGPNGTTLVAIGKTRFLMWASLVAAVINIILNAVLIPQWGIAGAASATTFSLTLHCIIRHIKIHTMLKINPLTKKLIIPSIMLLAVTIPISLLGNYLMDVTIWMLPLVFILFYGIYFVVFVISKSFDLEDIRMLNEIGNKLGLSTDFAERIIKRFS